MLYQFLWIFFIYAFLGWCTEVGYAALVTGQFVNRGFLNGPYCPIYGFGVVVVLACLTPLEDQLLVLFLGSVLLTSILEWLTGFVLEKLFHQRWWDYSDEPFNLGGYICLRFSIAWGFACIFVVKLLHPTVMLFIRFIPHTIGVILLAVLASGLAVDLAATVSTIVKLNRRLSRIDELAARIKASSNEFGEDLAKKVLDVAARGSDWKEDLDELAAKMAERRAELASEMDDWERQKEERQVQTRRQLEEWHKSMEELLNHKSFGQHRLLRAFPHLHSTDHRQALDDIRRHID